ncbi:MAG: acyl-CoA dehydrogenase family protein [Pseudomonadota bacterium]
MDFAVSDERRLLGDSLTRLLSEKCAFETRTAMAYAAPWHSPHLWDALAELGLFHAFLSDDHGGVGGSGFDIMTIFEPLGHALCPEPLLGQLMGLQLLAAAGADCDAALNGTTRLALAVDEAGSAWELDRISTRAEQQGMSWTLTGRKSMIYGGPAATDIFVAAGIEDQIGLFHIDSAAGARHDIGLIDGGGASEMLLDATPARLLLHNAADAIENALDWGRLALAAEALGAMTAAFDLLIDLLKTRQQFGRPIGQFQALQHRVVDLKVEMEQVRSITIAAAAAMGTREQSRTVAQMKALIGQTAHLIAQETIQMQGGIAMTWEYPASHYAKRLTMIDHQLGDSAFHLARLTASGGPG